MTENQAPYRTKYPLTVEEAVERLSEELPLKDKVHIAHMPEIDLIELFYTVGLHIRNEYGLTNPEYPLLRSCREFMGYVNLDPDDASMMIIKELWKVLQETHVMRVVK